MKRRLKALPVGILALCLPIPTTSWSPLFRSPRRVSSLSSRPNSRLWVAQQHSDVPVNNNTTLEVTTVDTPTTELEYDLLQEENNLLRETIRQLEQENERLKNSASRIVIENFEGEGKMAPDFFWNFREEQPSGITMTGEAMETSSSNPNGIWCDELDGDECPIEPAISFGEALRDRALWLVGLLIMQSCSGFILAQNELLLDKHPVIIYFLTMLVGAGGNAGNQASVRVIRGLALGTLNEQTQSQFLSRELKMAGALSAILSLAGFARAIMFHTPFAETVAVTAALMFIVFSSICLGAVLPLFLKKIGVDPAHSSTTIQVVMDILGVLLTVLLIGCGRFELFRYLVASKTQGSAINAETIRCQRFRSRNEARNYYT